VPVTVHPAELSALNVRQPKVDQLRSVEASLRLDAVASAGFRIPRSKCADAIKNGCAASPALNRREAVQ
jgi:RNA-binding protein YlmH